MVLVVAVEQAPSSSKWVVPDSEVLIENEGVVGLVGVGIDETSASMGGTVSMMKDGIPRGSLLFPARSVTCRVQPV